MVKKIKWVGTLSTTERNNIGLIQVRQNNVNSEVLGFNIVDGNGEPYDLKNRKVLFCTYFDRFAPVEQYAEVIENGKIVYTMNQHDMQKPVRINFAYFKILDEKDNLVDTTQNFSYDIMPSIESKCMNSEPYIIRLEEVLDAFLQINTDAKKELEQIIIDFNQQVIEQQQNFDLWFESIREILESIDPGGILLNEIVNARNSLLLNKNHKDLSSRLEDNDRNVLDLKILDITTRNNDVALNLKTYDGSGQATHPSVIYQNFGGYPYWLACTPYPFANDDYENPSIYFSQDGISFYNYGNNPIDQPTAEEITNGDYMSDPDVLIVNGVMNLFYRFNKGSEEFLLRKTSKDGRNWSEREIVYKADAGGSLSPAVIYDEEKFKVWYVKNNGTVWYTESSTGILGTWTERKQVTINYKNESYVPWHIDILKANNKIYLVLNASEIGNVNKRHLLIAESNNNNLIFNNAQLILSPRTFLNSSIDNATLYRSSMIKTVSGYRLYYSCMDRDQKWSISYVEGPTPYNMTSQKMMTDGNELSNPIATRSVNVEDGSYFIKDSILFRTVNAKAVSIVNSAANEISIMDETKTFFGFLKSKNLVLVVTSGDSGKLKIVKPGERSAGLTISKSKATTMRVEAENAATIGNLELNYLYLTGDYLNYEPAEGALRYNKGSKKHEGYDGSKWNELY